jgi:hypothetical protein
VTALVRHAPAKVARILKMTRELVLRYGLRSISFRTSRGRRTWEIPDPITDPAGIVDLDVRRRGRLGGVLHACSHTV